MKIAITGGHITPALAVIEKLREEKPDAEIFFFGRKFAIEGEKHISFESQIVRDLGINFVEINTGRLQRFISVSNLVTPFKLAAGVLQSLKFLYLYKVDLVLAFGGYVSVPVVIAAWLLRKPIIIHEQTFKLGMANRINAFFADKILVSWKKSQDGLPRNKTVLTGNPLRESIIRINKSSQFLKISGNIRPVIFITGGNQGSHTINILIKDVLSELLEKYIVIHQCGDASQFNDYHILSQLKLRLKKESRDNYYLYKSIDPDDMGAIYSISSAVVGRAGINTVSEIYYFGLPSVLIPLPFSGGGEQWINALWLKDNLNTTVLKQNEINAGDIIEALDKMTAEKNAPDRNSTDSVLLFKNAAENITSFVIDLYEAKNK